MTDDQETSKPLSTPDRPIFVTGGSGFVGKYVVAWLLERGVPIRALVRSPYRAPFSFHPNLELAVGDMLDEASLARAVSGAHAVVHLAANKYDPQKAFDVNVRGARNLVSACERAGVQRFINVSTQSAKIKQQGVYGSSKREAEDVFRNSKLNLTTIRPSLVYGPDEQSLFGFIAQQVMNLPVVPVLGSGEWRMWPVHVDDVAASILACLHRDETIGKTYDVGGADEVSLNQIIAMIGDAVGKKPRTVHIPFKVALAMAYAAAAILPNPPIRPDNVLGSNQDTHLDIEPMMRELHIEPVSLREGVRLTLQGKRRQAQTLKIGILGLGKIGLLHATILNRIPEAEVVAVGDVNAALGGTAKSMGFHVPFYTSLEKLLDAERPDAIYVCTPTFAHFEAVKSCLLQGVHVFVEKPVTHRAEISEELYRLAANSRSITAAGYFFRHRRTFRKGKELLERGVLGGVRSFVATCHHSEVFGPKDGWLFDRELSGGGVLINPTPHLFDLVRWYFGNPVKLAARTAQLYSQRVEDTGTVTFEFADGLHGTLETSWSVPNLPILRNTIHLQGENGTMRITHERIELELHKPYGEIPAGRSVQHESLWPEPGAYDLNPQAGGEAYFLHDQAFVSACLDRPHRGIISLQDAVESERLIHEAYRVAEHTDNRTGT